MDLFVDDDVEVAVAVADAVAVAVPVGDFDRKTAQLIDAGKA